MVETDETRSGVAPDLISVSEVASILSVSRATAYRMVGSGEIPAFRVGHQLRVDRRELLEWLHSPEDRVDVHELSALTGRSREWINEQAHRLPCRWNPRGEVLSVARGDLDAWKAAAESPVWEVGR